MTGQDYDEIDNLVREIRMRKQTIVSAKETLEGIDKPKNFALSIIQIEVRLNNGNHCYINKEHIPTNFLETFLNEVIDKAQKELVPLEKRFHSIKVSM